MKDYKEFPKPIKFAKLLGPSFIILALGLGSGEVILWPYLASNYGLGIVWGALLGITFQFFINMEIERYALIKGESVFVGLNRLFKWPAYWFIVSTFIGFGLPGIIAASAKVLAFVLGLSEFKWLAMVLLLAIGFILSSGRTVYGILEKITKTIIFVGVPIILILAVVLSNKEAWSALFFGMAGIGPDYWLLPSGIVLGTFLGAFAYSGAGGNLNLTQSIYIKEKGYGMGKYSQKISGLFKNVKEEQTIKLTGEDFALTEDNINKFKVWWRKINLEHLLVFWLLGFLAMCLLMVLAYSTAYGLSSNQEGINFIINEGLMIGQSLLPVIGIGFLILVSIMLFQTQLGILDSTSRIMAENAALKKLGHNEEGKVNLSKIYYIFIWSQIAFGVILFLFNIYEPKTLIILGAIINAFAMFIHIGLVSWLNLKTLPKQFRPKVWRRLIIGLSFLFFGIFSLLTFWEKIF